MDVYCCYWQVDEAAHCSETCVVRHTSARKTCGLPRREACVLLSNACIVLVWPLYCRMAVSMIASEFLNSFDFAMSANI